MNEQIFEILKIVVIVTTAILAYFKLFLHRLDTRIERKKKNIEILDSIANNGPNALSEEKEIILKLSALEKFNAYYETKFDFEKMVACLHTENPRKTIETVKCYSRNVKVIDKKIIPTRIFDDSNKNWKRFFFLYFGLSFLFAIFGLIYPELFAQGKELTPTENLILKIIYFGFLLFLVREVLNFNKAKKYLTNLS